jgi:NAD(P)-dependent dehydrogenase (short-subunit alcohol dehydrogenase family)
MGNRLQGKVALITGAASGIGRAIASRFALEGAKITLVDINSTAGRELVDKITANGSSATFIKADLGNLHQVRNAIDATIARWGSLDILINNAAIEFVGTIEQTSEQDWERIITNDLKSVFLCSKFAIPHMIKRGGAIINIASTNGLLGVPEHAAYNSAKGGVISLTRQLAVDYGPSNIRVNCICPCTTDTPMVRKSISAADPGQYLKELGKNYPLRRIGKPEDIANAVLFLASDEASWITGVILPVDGGSSSSLERTT